MNNEKLASQYHNLFEFEESRDGNAINIRKYTAEDISQLTARDVKRVENTISVVKHFSDSVKQVTNSLKDKRKLLFWKKKTALTFSSFGNKNELSIDAESLHLNGGF